MNSNQKNNQFGQGSEIDDEDKNFSPGNPSTSDDDFLSGDNAKKTYPDNQNNASRDYNEKSMSPGRNPNIGGDESEYETSTSDAEEYGEDAIADNTEGFANRRDTEEIDRHIDQSRYSSPSTRNRSEE
jgi:hypothetical protein